MDAVIKKWGNSPALRLNAAAMKAAAFNLDEHVTVTASSGRIVIERAEPAGPALDDLLAAISDDNLHESVEFGPPVGREAL